MGIKHQVNEDFFKKWTPEMAYVLGYFYADGNMENVKQIRAKYIKFSSAEKNNIEKIKKWMNSSHRIVERIRDSKYKLYSLRIGSHILYCDLEKFGLCPNKSLMMKFQIIPKKYLSHFIRGYFDGDGCVRICMKNGKKQLKIINKLCTVFTSGSKNFLVELAENINKLADTKLLKVYNGHRSYMLSYTTADSVKIFKLMYEKVKKPLYLERKKAVYRHYFEIRPQRVDKIVKSVLQYSEVD